MKRIFNDTRSPDAHEDSGSRHRVALPCGIEGGDVTDFK